MVKLCKEIVIFLVLAKVLEGFCGGNKYGKFIKVMISLVVLLKLMTPLISLFGKNPDISQSLERIEEIFYMEDLDKNTSVLTENVDDVKIEEIDIEVENIAWEK